MPVIITCSYSPGFPALRQPAIERAAATWAALLDSQFPIRVRVIWDPNIQLPPDLSAMCIPQGRRNGANLTANTWYVSSLAKKLINFDHHLGEQDMALIFNAGPNLNWNNGPAQAAPNQYDLESIALHEMGHGMGFVGLFWVDNAQPPLGSYGNDAILHALPALNQHVLGFPPLTQLDGQPSQFGGKVIDSLGRTLVAPPYVNGSALLAQALNGEIGNSQLRYALPNAPQGGPQLYVPYQNFTPFSSIEHLDDPQSLMYFSIGLGVTRRQVDQPVIDIMHNLGW
jgi:hypothetical protein